MNFPPPRRPLEAYTRRQIPADPGLGRRASGNAPFAIAGDWHGLPRRVL